MIPVDQTTFHDPEKATSGNCMQAAVASLMGLNLKEVPNFVEVCSGESHAMYELFRRWLDEYGLDMLSLPGAWSIRSFYLGVGPSPRGVHHMVVLNDGELAHDPHPSRAGLLRVERCYVLVPKVVANWRLVREPGTRIPTEDEIEAGKSQRGGWTRAQLAEWGVPWPPPKGWRARLLRAAGGVDRAR